MSGGGEYTGDFTNWFGSGEKVINWDRTIGKEFFTSLGLTDTSVLDASKGKALLTLKSEQELEDFIAANPGAREQIWVGGLIIASYMKMRAIRIESR